MSRSRFSEQELRLEAERSVKYRGTARVRLEVLHFQWNEPRELSRKNVERLKEVFRTDKIRRLEPRNHIPAVVDQTDLDDAIQASEISAESLLSNPDNDPPMLRFPARHRLTCLHGRHRIQAARETLPPTDAWWTVDLYLADTNPELRTTLVEEYSNEEKPSDGEVYRKIRQYEREGNVCFKKRWKALLSDHGRRGLRQLFDHGDGELTTAFDKLLDIPGLWDGMRISTLHKMIGMKCDEEVLHYLEHIRKVWHKLLREDKAALQKVDQVTVRALELRAPRYSKRDAQVIQGQLLSGQIFNAFSQQEREAIWDELRSIDGLIPSLYTLFEDLKYLSACADCLKRLVKLSRRDTVSTALQRKFPYTNQTGDQYILEVAESTFVNRPGPTIDRLDLGYRQLWLCTMRHYREMPTDAKKKKKDLLAKAGVERADEEVLSEFAALADRLGFESPEIQALKQRSSDIEIARNALLKARKPDRYQYDETILEANIAQIVRLFTTAAPLPCEYSSPALVSDNPNGSGNRCGFPDEDAQQQDSKSLFIPYLHDESDEQGEDVTSFFVRRSVYLAFFGKSVNLGMGSNPNHSQSPRHGTQRTGFSASQGQQMLDREELERAEAERRKQERQEQERLEQERREQERREQERLELERREQERRERERRERERSEQERREQERLDQERLDQERLDQERLEQERREQQRLEQERLELKRIEERAEREELQERLAQALEAQEKIEQEKQHQQELEKQEQEKQEEERRRQETREKGRREQEEILKDSERIRKRHTQIDMESLVSGSATGNQIGSNLQSGRELVVADPILDTACIPQIPANDQTSRQQSMEAERREQEGREQERLEQERQEQERQKRLELERLEQERLEQERLEQERREQEKLEQEKLEKERLEQERLEQLEQERLQQERLEQERREQERLEQERLELRRLERAEAERREQERRKQERLEQERLEQERLEHERLEQERLEQEKLEQERLEQERLKQERLERLEQERLEQERLEQERLEQERLEQERLEQERLERLEQERLEQERLKQERLEQEKLEQERLEQERLEQERLELRRIQESKEQERQEERRRQETREQEKTLKDSERTRKRHTQIDMESLVSGSATGDQRGLSAAGQAQTDDHHTGQENSGSDLQSVAADSSSNTARNPQTPANDLQGSTPLARKTPRSIRIMYKVQERGVWRTTRSLYVDPSDPSEVERVAVKYMRKRIRLFDTELNILTPADCFEAATANGSNAILLIPEAEINISEELETSISKLESEEESTTEKGRKRGRR